MQKTNSNKKKTHFSKSNFRICLLGSKNSYLSLALVAFFWPAKTRQKQGKQKVIAWWWSRWRFSSRVLKGGTVLCLKNKKKAYHHIHSWDKLKKKKSKMTNDLLATAQLKLIKQIAIFFNIKYFFFFQYPELICQPKTSTKKEQHETYLCLPWLGCFYLKI